jgi:hypothetical protein
MKDSDTLFQEYIREMKWKKRVWILSRILGFGSLAIYTFMVFKAKYTDSPKFVGFSYFAAFTNLSHLMWIKYFEIPDLFLSLLDPDKSEHAFQTIQKYHDLTVPSLLSSVHGINKKPDTKQFGRMEWIHYIQDLDRLDWKKYGKRYLYFYLFVLGSFLFFLCFG